MGPDDDRIEELQRRYDRLTLDVRRLQEERDVWKAQAIKTTGNHLSQTMFRLAEARSRGPIPLTAGGTENHWREAARSALNALLGPIDYGTEVQKAYYATHHQSPSDRQAFTNLFILFAVILESEGL